MSTSIPRIEFPDTRGVSSPEARAVLGPQSPQDSDPAPDRSPFPVGGHEDTRPKRGRGFAVMDHALVSEIARKGGRAAHSAGTAHEFTSEEARAAGRKGGRATNVKRRQSVEVPHGDRVASEPRCDAALPVTFVRVAYDRHGGD
jgi:general stress protein YciG